MTAAEDDGSSWRRICNLLASRGHKVEFGVAAQKRLSISIKFDALVDEKIVIQRRDEFEYQMSKLQDIGYSIYVAPKSKMTVSEIKSFVDAIEAKDSGNGRK